MNKYQMWVTSYYAKNHMNFFDNHDCSFRCRYKTYFRILNFQRVGFQRNS